MQQTPPSSTAGKTLAGIVLLVIALFCVIGANNILSAANNVTANTATDPDPNAPVTCDGQVMSPGDTCDHIISGATFHYSYDEQQSYQASNRTSDAKIQSSDSQKNPGYILLIVALFAALFGLGLLSQARKVRQAYRQRNPVRF
ncbi:MAG TPA: hypothetical protein VF458_04635 [Ktedonobacteraceae bacterium]